MRHSKPNLFYAGLDSKTAIEVLPSELIDSPKTVVFSEDGTLFFKSEAIFKILNYLNFPFELFKVFRLFPTSWNDRLYDWVAKNRNRWFGRSKQCFIATAKYKSRFLD